MPDPISSIVSGGVSGFADAFKTIWSTFKLTPEQKAAADAAIEANDAKLKELDQQLQIKQIDAATQADATAGETIRAMLLSSDSAVRRAPVAVIWTGCFVIVWNYILLSAVHIWKPNAQPFDLPTAFWTVWLCATLGFVGHAAAQNALSGNGGALSFLGIKLDSKGDK